MIVNNTVSLAIIKLDYSSLNMTSSVTIDHLLLLLEGQNPIYVDITNVEISNTKVIELWNNRSIAFSGDEQLYLNMCEFGYFYDQVGFEMDSNKQAWMANMTMMNSSIHDNNNNGGLLKFLNANLHVEELSVILFENVNIWNNTDVIEIIEDSNNDNSVLSSRFNLFEMRNVVFYENSGTVLYHSYPNKPSYNIDIYSSEFRDNIEASLSTKSSFSGNSISNSSVMIEIIEDGSDCTQLVNDGSSMANTESNAHFYVYQSLFLGNEYSESNIYQYCAISHIAESNMTSNEATMLDLTLVDLFLQDSRMSSHIGDSFSGSDIVSYTPDMFDAPCDICLNDDTNSWIDNCVFEDSFGILLFSKGNSMMRVTNSDFLRHDGIVALLNNHENDINNVLSVNYSSSFENVTVSDCVINDGDASVFHLRGPVTNMYRPYIGLLNVEFLNNFGQLFGSTRTVTDVTTIGSELNYLDCALSSDYGGDANDTWDKNGIFSFENVLFSGNNISSLHSYLFKFEYHDIRMKSVEMSENICYNSIGSGIVTDLYDEGCVKMIDSSLSLEESSFWENSGEFIFSISRLIETIDDGNVQELDVCLHDVSELDDIGNSFIFLYNQSSEDSLFIKDSNFSSGSLDYILYMTSSLEAVSTSSPDLTNVTIVTSWFLNASESALAWISSDLDKFGFVDFGSNGDIGLDLNVSHSRFETTVMIGYFGSELSGGVAGSTASRLNFEYNDFIDYRTRYANDYVFFYENEGSSVLIDYTGNEWMNLDVSSMIISNGPVSMWHESMTIGNDINYLLSDDPLYISFNNMQFNHFREIMTIYRNNSAMDASNPLNTQIEWTNSNVTNELSDNNGSDSQVIYFYNMLATDSVYLNNVLFKGHSYITMYLGEETSVDVETYKIDVGGDKVHFGIEDCLFSNYNGDSALYIHDIDLNGTNNLLYNSTYRVTTKILNSIFNNAVDSKNVITLNYIDNNYNNYVKSLYWYFGCNII